MADDLEITPIYEGGRTAFVVLDEGEPRHKIERRMKPPWHPSDSSIVEIPLCQISHRIRSLWLDAILSEKK